MGPKTIHARATTQEPRSTFLFYTRQHFSYIHSATFQLYTRQRFRYQPWPAAWTCSWQTSTCGCRRGDACVLAGVCSPRGVGCVGIAGPTRFRRPPLAALYSYGLHSYGRYSYGPNPFSTAAFTPRWPHVSLRCDIAPGPVCRHLHRPAYTHGCVGVLWTRDRHRRNPFFFRHRRNP